MVWLLTDYNPKEAWKPCRSVGRARWAPGYFAHFLEFTMYGWINNSKPGELRERTSTGETWSHSLTDVVTVTLSLPSCAPFSLPWATAFSKQQYLYFIAVGIEFLPLCLTQIPFSKWLFLTIWLIHSDPREGWPGTQCPSSSPGSLWDRHPSSYPSFILFSELSF